jgi:hypothetical protein
MRTRTVLAAWCGSILVGIGLRCTPPVAPLPASEAGDPCAVDQALTAGRMIRDEAGNAAVIPCVDGGH